MDIDVNVRERILSPISNVFDAVRDPARMAQYFISSASGPVEAGKDIVWEFADVGAKIPVHGVEVVQDALIAFEWAASGQSTRTTIKFEADGTDATVVTITESSFPMTEEGVKRALGQNAGWIYTLCGLKAYVQFGINLRTGLDKRLTDV